MLSKSDLLERICNETYCKKLPDKEFYDLFVSVFKGNVEFTNYIGKRITDIALNQSKLEKNISVDNQLGNSYSDFLNKLSRKDSCKNMTDDEFKEAVLVFPRQALESKWACKRMPYKDTSFPYNGLEYLARRYPETAFSFAHVLNALSDDVFTQLLEENPEFKETFITQAILARKSKMLQNNDELNADNIGSFKC